MGHARVNNTTPFEYESLHVADEEGRPVLAAVVRGTFVLGPAVPTIAAEQDPIRLAGLAHGDPGSSSYRFEPETAFLKPGVDVVVVGHAHAPKGRCRQMTARVQVGPLDRRLAVSGDRHWDKGLLGARPTEPEPFERMPLVWERAFGGWDRHHEDEAKHRSEARNPLGVGYRRRFAPFIPGAPLPNVEDPKDPQVAFIARCQPAGLGFTQHDWMPRRELAGTFDAKWTASRSPLLPTDFDRRFFNAAPTGMVATEPLEGARCRLEGLTPEGLLEFELPRVEAPTVRVGLTRGAAADLTTRLDTVVIDTDAGCLYLTWRAHLALSSGPHDVSGLELRCAGLPDARAARPEPVPFEQPLRLQPLV